MRQIFTDVYFKTKRHVYTDINFLRMKISKTIKKFGLVITFYQPLVSKKNTFPPLLNTFNMKL